MTKQNIGFSFNNTLVILGEIKSNYYYYKLGMLCEVSKAKILSKSSKDVDSC